MRPLIAAIAAVVLACPVARANVTYEFVNTSYTVIPLLASIIVTDQAAASEQTISFSGSSPGYGATPTIAGSSVGLISFRIGEDVFNPNSFAGTVSVSLTPTPTSIDVGIHYLGVSSEANIGNTQATFGEDGANCSISGPLVCRATGYWGVPEPSSFSLLMLGMIAVPALSRRLRVTD